MKLNFGKKLLLFIHWLLSLLLFAFTLVRFVAPQPIDALASLVNGLLGDALAEFAGIALLVFYLIFAVAAIIILFARPDKRAERGFITVDSSDAGRTRIAIGAVDQMIRQAVRAVNGITEMKSSIVNNVDSISIACTVTIANGAHVPTVTMNIQRAIRGYIELNCGVAVRDVSVSVQSLDDGEGKGRKKGFKAVPAAVPAETAYVPEPVKADVISDPVAEEIPAAAEEEPVLPEIEPIALTLDPPADAAEENPAEE